MANFGDMMKSFLKVSAKAVGRTATGLVSATRYKMDEMGYESRRREAIAELGAKVLELVRNGAELPEELTALVAEINQMDEGMEDLRTEHAAEKAAVAEKVAAEKAERKEAREADRAARAAAKAAADQAARQAAEAAEAAAEVTEEAVEENVPVYTAELTEEEEAPAEEEDDVPNNNLAE